MVTLEVFDLNSLLSSARNDGHDAGYAAGERAAEDRAKHKAENDWAPPTPVVNDYHALARVLASELTDKKITAIRILRSVTSLGLKEAKDMIETYLPASTSTW